MSLVSYMSTTVDEHVGRHMGQMDVEEFVRHLVRDATRPEHLDALAFQLLCMQRRLKTANARESSRLGSTTFFLEAAAQWKAQRLLVEAHAAEARARIAAAPSRLTHPGFFDGRGATRPGMLYHEVHLPHAFVLDLDADQPAVSTGVYSSPLVADETYRVRSCRDMKAWVDRASGGGPVAVELRLYQALAGMGRVRAVPLSAFMAAKARSQESAAERAPIAA
jgi:hypothetical protein